MTLRHIGGGIYVDSPGPVKDWGPVEWEALALRDPALYRKLRAEEIARREKEQAGANTDPKEKE
jgi:hypothetical protein